MNTGSVHTTVRDLFLRQFVLSRFSTEHLASNMGTVGSHPGSARTSAECSLASSRESSTTSLPYKVVMLGGAGVGKSSLISQFMTSEYLHAYDTSLGELNCTVRRTFIVTRRRKKKLCDFSENRFLRVFFYQLPSETWLSRASLKNRSVGNARFIRTEYDNEYSRCAAEICSRQHSALGNKITKRFGVAQST